MKSVGMKYSWAYYVRIYSLPVQTDKTPAKFYVTMEDHWNYPAAVPLLLKEHSLLPRVQMSANIIRNSERRKSLVQPL